MTITATNSLRFPALFPDLGRRNEHTQSPFPFCGAGGLAALTIPPNLSVLEPP